jgi:hypothetical protein
MIYWVAAGPSGGHRKLRGGREFALRQRPGAPWSPPSTAAPSSPEVNVAPAPSGLEAFGMVERLMSLIDRKTEASVSSVSQMVSALRDGGGGGRGGFGAAELELVLLKQSEANAKATAAAVAAAVAPIQAQLAALQSDDDDDGSPVVGAALGAAAPFFKGKGTAAALINLAAAHPELAQTAIDRGLPFIAESVPAIMGGLGKFLELFKPAAKPRAMAPVVVMHEPPPPPPPEAPQAPRHAYGSLSNWGPEKPPPNAPKPPPVG